MRSTRKRKASHQTALHVSQIREGFHNARTSSLEKFATSEKKQIANGKKATILVFRSSQQPSTADHRESSPVIASEGMKNKILEIGINKCARESGFDRHNFVRKLVRGIPGKNSAYSEFARWLPTYETTHNTLFSMNPHPFGELHFDVLRIGSIAGWSEAVWQDLRYAARGLCKAPAFTLVAVLTLTLGIGGITTIFSAVDALLLRPLPYPDQDRLVALSNSYPRFPRDRGPVSGTDVAHWRADNQVLEQIEFVSHPDMVAMSSARSAERVGVQHVSARLLPLLGIKSLLGSLPSDDKTERQGSLTVAISYEFWQSHFAGDPKILGRPIFVDTWSATIGAVLNPGFDLFGGGTPEVFEIDGIGNGADSGVNDPRWVFAVGKLKPGVSVQQAQSAMNLTAQRLAQVFPEAYKDVGVRVEPLQKGLFGWSEEVFYLLFAAVGFVLLIACANVANLLLVRGDGRRREIGVRVALGASRMSLIRQLLIESVLLALVGGLAGLILSFVGLRILIVLSTHLLPTAGVSVNGRVLFFTFGICILTGLVFGLIPAYRASKSDPNECLREGGRTTATKSRHRTRNILVVAEIAVALVSLICAGLMINTLTRILRTSPGFSSDHLLTAEVRLTGVKYMDSTDPGNTGLNVIKAPVVIFCRQALERVRGIPGVENAAFVDWLPLAENAQHAYPGFTIVGKSVDVSAEKPTLIRDAVSADYFHLMDIPIMRGRGITEQDTETSAPVVVISEATARQFWPNEDPIGREITFDSSPEERPRQIVGIVGNVKQYVLTMDSQAQAYVSYLQLPAHTVPGWTESRVHKSLIIRTRSSSAALIENVRRAISALAPDSAVFGVTTVEKTVSNSARPWSVLSQLLGLFGAMALILAAIGIYGVISYSVSERSHELGLRMALGAQPRHVVLLVLRQAMTLSFLGLIIGVAGSFAAAPLLAEFLYGVKPHDVLTLVLVSSLLLAVTFFASYIPARHATEINPMDTLRHD
jgi:putative ABC transport system permease protein